MVHFSLKIWHLAAKFLIVFLKIRFNAGSLHNNTKYWFRSRIISLLAIDTVAGFISDSTKAGYWGRHGLNWYVQAPNGAHGYQLGPYVSLPRYCEHLNEFYLSRPQWPATGGRFTRWHSEIRSLTRDICSPLNWRTKTDNGFRSVNTSMWEIVRWF